VPVQVVHRKREGYRDRADLLEPGTVRMGQTTFAKRRQPGERHGALRPLT
jgi:sulfate adenylyltransferase subunit 1 (EFTu-like GTPase family)